MKTRHAIALGLLFAAMSPRAHAAIDLVDEKIRAEGVLAIDYVEYDDRNVRDAGFRYDRAMLRLGGDLTERISWRVSGDLRGVDTQWGMEDAWLSYTFNYHARVTLGLVKIPMGVEYAIPEEDLSFIGYAFPAYLYGRKDWGIKLDGEVSEGLFSYEIDATIGNGYDPNGQDRNEPLYSARIVTYPLVHTELPVVRGLFAGLGYAYMTEYDGQLDVANPLRNKLFDTPELEGDSSEFYVVSWGIDAGSVRFFHEFGKGSISGLKLPDGTTEDLEDQITAWAATLSWMITGETYDSRPYRARDGRQLDLPEDESGWGAWELAARYANGDIDRDFFKHGFTDYDESSQEFRVITGAVNWYATNWMRWSIEVTRTIADQYPQVFDSHGRDTSYVLRAQFSF